MPLNVLYLQYNQICIILDLETIKANFNALRKEQGLSWADLAAKAGVSDYHRIANNLNTKGLTLATLEKLATLVNVEPWELLKPPTPIKQKFTICPHCGQIIPKD